MLKDKKSEYETSWIYGIDESRTEMGMAFVFAGASSDNFMVVTQEGELD